MANNLVVCGGTFDHFHKGHESLLKLSLSLGNKVVIGVTSDKFVRSWKVDDRSWKQIEPFEKRKRAVLEFVKKEKASNKTEIVKIEDLFGPTLDKDLHIDVIVVSENTKKGAEIINDKRKELGLKDLKILIVPLSLAEDGKLISSARIRNGEINRIGKLYVKQSWLKEDFVLPEDLRQEFKKPLGELVSDVPKDNDPFGDVLVITVGDAATKKINESSVRQNISVVDFKIARKERFSSFSELGFLGGEKVIAVNNPAGRVTSDLTLAISKIFESDFENRIIIKIIGEEDLAVLPLILLAPLNTIIYYGQPLLRQGSAGQAGLVKVVVSEDSKNKAYNLFLKLKQA